MRGVVFNPMKIDDTEFISDAKAVIFDVDKTFWAENSARLLFEELVRRKKVPMRRRLELYWHYLNYSFGILDSAKLVEVFGILLKGMTTLEFQEISRELWENSLQWCVYAEAVELLN